MSGNSELAGFARAALKGHWGNAVALYIIFLVVTAVSTSFSITLLLIGPLVAGWSLCCLRIARRNDEEVQAKEMFYSFTELSSFLNCLLAGVIVAVITLAGFFLLIIPGIYFSCRYAMVFFVLADNPEMKAGEAIKRSAAIMNGRIWKYICLNLRFAGWWLLSILTFGIGFLFLQPYMQCTFAAFYDEARIEYDSRKAGEAFSFS